MALTQLIYASDLVNGDETQLAPILESAVRHNREDDITGMLLYSGGNFLQVLEGAANKVNETYQRICHDLRHTNIIILIQKEVDERHFPDWSMGYHKLTKEDVSRFPEHAPYFQFGFKPTEFKAKPGAALELLKLFSQGMR